MSAIVNNKPTSFTLIGIEIIDKRREGVLGGIDLDLVNVEISIKVESKDYKILLSNNGDGRLHVLYNSKTKNEFDELCASLGFKVSDSGLNKKSILEALESVGLSDVVKKAKAKFSSIVTTVPVNANEVEERDMVTGVVVPFEEGVNGFFIQCYGDGYITLINTNSKKNRELTYIIDNEIAQKLDNLSEKYPPLSKELFSEVFNLMNDTTFYIRGGYKHGNPGGRKKIDDSLKSKGRTVRMTDTEWEKLKALGGSNWIREKLNNS
jgi:hypothetical protein